VARDEERLLRRDVCDDAVAGSEVDNMLES